jgi:hypothetical protein
MAETPQAAMARQQYRRHSETHDNGALLWSKSDTGAKTNELYEGFTFGRDVWA